MYTNLTAYPGLGFRHYIHGNRLHHCLILQATYSLVQRGGNWVLEPLEKQPGLTLADVPRPVLALPAGDDPGADARAREQISSLRTASDLVPFKPNTDVLINGDAIAPEGQPALQWLAGIRIGNWEKLLKISGPRHWERDRRGNWRLSAPEAAERVQLLYEHAYGGTVLAEDGKPQAYADNPSGIGFLGSPAMEPPQPFVRAPSIEYADELTPPAPGRIQRVAGFGSMPMHWAPRDSRLGTVDVEAVRRDGPSYPEDFDPAYWQVAPSDQWLPWLRPGQEVELVNLIEGEPSVRFALPGWLAFAAARSGTRTRYPDMNMDTLEIDALQRTVRLVWRVAIADAPDRPEWIGMEMAIPELLYPPEEQTGRSRQPLTQAERWRAASSRDKGEV
jgi:hypothetical protein